MTNPKTSHETSLGIDLKTDLGQRTRLE
jgi:hypothetical protein